MTASSNLDLVRSIVAAWERGNFHSTEWADPEIEYVIVDGPAPGRWTGLTDMQEGARQYLRGWAELRVEVDARIAKGAWLFHVVDERVRRVVRYWDRDRAFADLGLAPEGRLP